MGDELVVTVESVAGGNIACTRNIHNLLSAQQNDEWCGIGKSGYGGRTVINVRVSNQNLQQRRAPPG